MATTGTKSSKGFERTRRYVDVVLCVLLSLALFSTPVEAKSSWFKTDSPAPEISQDTVVTCFDGATGETSSAKSFDAIADQAPHPPVPTRLETAWQHPSVVSFSLPAAPASSRGPPSTPFS